MDLCDLDDLPIPAAEDLADNEEQQQSKPKKAKLVHLERITLPDNLDEIPPAILEMAATKMQQHKLFVAAELELMQECERINGMAIYKRPDPWEIARRCTQHRRREIMNALEQHAEMERVMVLAAKRQSKKQFRRTEERIEGDCHATKGEWRVEYEPPSPTELAPGTDTRRKRLQRKLDKYYRTMAYSFAVAKTYVVSKMPAHLRWTTKTSTIVRCKLGSKKCPCRGIRWDHSFFLWHESADDEGGDFIKDDNEERFKRRCSECKNVYDKRFSGEAMDKIAKYCEKYVSELEDAADADDKASTYGTQVLISAAKIQVGLLPKLKALLAKDTSDDECLAEMKIGCKDWISGERVKQVDEAKGEMKEWNNWLDKYGRTNRNAPPIPSGDSCDLIHLICPTLYAEEMRLEGIEIE